jgi:ribosomal protein S18 acetylase RimI-like enzyme
MFKIVEVDESNKDDVVKRLQLDLLHNLFVVYGLIYESDKAIAYVAYGRDDSLKGLLSIYRRTPPMVRLDGEERVAHKLLEFLSKENMILFCPPTLLNIVKSKFPEANCYVEYQMYVAKGEERLITPNLAERLKPEHASLLADLYSSSPEEWQFSRSEQRCKELLEKCGVYGVFEADKLVSAAVSVKRLPQVGEVIGVFTHPRYRGRSFGKMVVSASTEGVLKHADGSNLYVGAYNTPAIKVYEKLGYRKIDEWYWVDIGTGRKP